MLEVGRIPGEDKPKENKEVFDDLKMESGCSDSEDDSEEEEEEEEEEEVLTEESGTESIVSLDEGCRKLSLVSISGMEQARLSAKQKQETESISGEKSQEGIKSQPIMLEPKLERIKTKAEPETGRRRKRKRRRAIGINLTNCKYESVRRAAKLCGLKEVGDEDEWTVYWTDCSVSLERVMDMKRFQKINHFPGMNEICRKDLLARNLNRLLKLFPKEYNIFPPTWCLPADYGDFQAHCRVRKNKTYICKPDSGCQGRGIFISRNPKDIKHGDHMICQQYIAKPFLIDGYKFDMRLYVLVTSCEPLRVFVYHEGLARFATMSYLEPSNSNLDEICMHLTNYAINKHNENFIRDDTTGSKRKLSTLNAWMKKNCYETSKVWEEIEDVIIKALISAHPTLKHNYRTCFPNHVAGNACFEILGFDILLDRKLKPWLLEVNHSPSFTTDSDLDREVKDALLFDTFNLINLRACDKRKMLEEDKRRVKERLFQRHPPRETRREQLENSQAAWLEEAEKYENIHLGGYRRIYPGAKTDKYDKFFKHNGSLFQETVASRAREECARQQLEELRLKQEHRDIPAGKKRKEIKENLQGESAEEKAVVRKVMKRPPTRNTYIRIRNPDRKLDKVVIDIMKPLDIDEEEETERVRGLLQRENLIRGLGIVEKLYRLLRAVNSTTPNFQDPENCLLERQARNQPQLMQDLFMCQDSEALRSLAPISFLGGQTTDLRIQARSLSLETQGCISGFLDFSGRVIPTTQCVLQCFPQKKCLSWSGGLYTGTPAAAAAGINEARKLKMGVQQSFSNAKNKALVKGTGNRKLSQVNGVFSGSLNMFPHVGKARALTTNGCILPAVTGSQVMPPVRELRITSVSAPVSQRLDHMNHLNALDVLNLNLSRKWT
ncbi:tubulin polyglutamylase TTLL6 isoform X2 [Rhinatrema bivittatum]|uniref:tubulin polyglutamylase TTLL6 isoform X2 n=1 Tax=Rhinatrema bivittatum TaxID=194408 RepID=UPI00112CF4D8|nr:tubulin polyglutamylase TTLL6 isoform X2 [Rhinatrema bivittatum]